jgi:hypothetical protein
MTTQNRERRAIPPFRGWGRSRVFQRRLARAAAAVWQLATGTDYRYRTIEGPPQRLLSRLTTRYITRVMQAATRRFSVRRRLEEVLLLLQPPLALFTPGVVASLVWDELTRVFELFHRAHEHRQRPTQRRAFVQLSSNE